MSDSPFVVDVTANDFSQVVIEGSRQHPVLVDFWADWCAPCRMLAPILETIARDMQGNLLVAKVNTEEQRELAAQFGIRSLPTVKLFKDGRPVDEFMGALPESDIRALLDKHIPRESDHILEQAEAWLAKGATDKAAALVDQARTSDPENPRAMLVYARLQAVLGNYETAENALDSLPLAEHAKPEVQSLRARIMFDRVVSNAPDVEQLEKRLNADPNDSEARYQLAARRFIANDHEAALEEFLTLLRKDRKYGDDAARKAMVRIFELLGGSGELVTRYRAKMTSALF